MVKKGGDPQEVLFYAIEAEEGLNIIEEGKIATLWSLARVYRELGNIKSLNIVLKESLWKGLTIEDCRSKYRNYLELAYHEVMEQAQKIKSRKYRNSFLTNVCVNREVIAAWEKMGN